MHVPRYNQLKQLYRQLTPVEFSVFIVAALLMIIGVFGILHELQQTVSTAVPVQGGSLSEGIVGFPRYINPVLASTDADQDTTALVYAGLTKLTVDGDIELDLAEDLEISADGRTYTFTIREDARFHDGRPVGAEDVVYTVNMIQDQRIGSPLDADWSGVSVNAIDDKTIKFELSDPFGDFLYNVRIGILPKHLWINETADTFPFSLLNTNPVGAGPYKVVDVDRNNEGLPTRYNLSAFADYHNSPFIEEIKLNFFATATERNKAFTRGKVDSLYGLSPKDIKELSTGKIVAEPLTRIFAIFLNQNNNEALVDSQVRKALSVAINRPALIDEVLDGYADSLYGPLPTDTEMPNFTEGEISDRHEEAQKLLAAAGWNQDGEMLVNDNSEQLTITLTTADVSSLRATADYVAESWKELGVNVIISVLPTADLSQEVIRPRDYEALLFGQLINQGRDLYPFWHSSQQDDPGLNLAMYANSNADTLLEQYRQATSSQEKTHLSREASEEITADQPAIFLYTPHFIYVVPKNMKHLALPPISTAADRFDQIETWYIKTINVWNVFVDDDGDKEASQAASTTTATSSDSS